MAVITDADIKKTIIARVGDTKTLTLAGIIDSLWNNYQDKALIAPRLQELYTQRDCIDVVLASPEIRNAVGFGMSGDLSLRLGERHDHLTMRRKETQAEIDKLEVREAALQQPALEELRNKEIETPPPFFLPPQPGPIDANDPRYRGDPYDATQRTRRSF